MSDFVNTLDLVGDDALTDSIIDRSITEIADDAVETVGVCSFRNCAALTTANFLVATSIGENAFYNCSALTTANLPLVTSIGSSAFGNCKALTALILRKTDAICTLSAANAFTETPIASGTGYIYVPRALVDSYKAAINWSTYAEQFRALGDYTVDGTTTGELDPNKI